MEWTSQIYFDGPISGSATGGATGAATSGNAAAGNTTSAANATSQLTDDQGNPAHRGSCVNGEEYLVNPPVLC